MLLRVPDFYPKFHCIAGKCTDTCCVGWEIDVDESSLARYKFIAAQGSNQRRQTFARKVLDNIEEGHFKLKPGDRCPFLKDDGLCEMICELGSNGTDLDEKGECVLGEICREHPRFVEVYGDIMEKGVGLCCEEAVRLLLTSNAGKDSAVSACHSRLDRESSILHFVESEVNEEPDEMPEDVEEARDAIFEERERVYQILADQSMPFNQRLLEMLDYAVETSGMNDETIPSKESLDEVLSDQAIKQTWIEILGEGESYGPAWDSAYERIIRKGWQQPQSLFSDEDGTRIIAYMIFRYYAKSLFDGDSLTKVQFAIYFWIMLKHFGEELAADSPAGAADLIRKINAVKLLSKQTEYSEEIMVILADNFFENPAFSVEQFRRILSAMGRIQQ